MELDQRDFLQRLLNAPGPSGFESIPAGIWREEAAKYADEVDHDVIGNSYAYLRSGDTDFTVAIVGHIDEIGFQIRGSTTTGSSGSKKSVAGMIRLSSVLESASSPGTGRFRASSGRKPRTSLSPPTAKK